jgi:hypothetical protein
MKLNLNYKEMPILTYKQRKELPPQPGIYYVGDQASPVMYVGLARNLRNRHLNHHRQAQFEGIEDAAIRYRVVSEDILAKITDLGKVLSRLEKQAINYYAPPLNNTPLPEQPAFTTLHAPVYIQSHNISKEGYCGHFDSQDGEELGINTSKLPLLTRAIREERPVFLIASGLYKDYERPGYPNLSQLAPYSSDRIYLLVSRFIPYGYEQVNYPNQYILYGANSKIFVNPYTVLNSEPGFKEFRESYLKLGFTNCERSLFAKQLLCLGDFKLLWAA